MPGRQSHGRSLLGNAKPAGGKGKQQKSKSKARAHALDAFAIAAKQIEPEKITRRGRDLDLDPENKSRAGKHRRDEDDDDDDDDDSEEDEDEAPRKKRPRQSALDEEDGEDGDRSDVEGGSDSEGNEWHVGVNGDDDDSELDSDEAFGESDDEKFEGYTFRGSRSQKKQDDSDDDGGDDGGSLGSDAIDLADALDQSSDDDEASAGDTESGSEEDGSDSDSDLDDEEEDDEVDVSKLGELQKLIKGFAGTEEDAEAGNRPSSKQAISLEDLGLSGVKDPLIKKSVKLMKKEQKAEATNKGSTKKLDVPLPRRQQDQLLRTAAYEKTNETLDRWNDTVKHNRRADHLMFPLAHTLPDAGLDNGELQPLTKKTAGTELEQTIMSIMEESGLGPSAKSKDQPQKQIDPDGKEQTVSRAELKNLWAQRRRERELESREQARSKRIKKIKSKTYRRIHRKERLGDEADQLEEMRANGDIDSEEEREAAHRRRALERVGAKHKESKWAKMGSKVGRAVWDDDYRAGLTDMARRNEELRKRVEGKTATGRDGEDDSDVSSASGDDDEDRHARLLKQLDAADEAEDDDSQPHAGLMKMAFMQRAEARRKQANDELEAELRRDLGSGSGEEEEEEDDTEVQVGRRTFGTGKDQNPSKSVKESSAPSRGAISNGTKSKSTIVKPNTSSVAAESSSAPESAGGWQTAASKWKKGKKAVSSSAVAELDLESAVQVPVKSAPKARKAKAKEASSAGTEHPSTAVQADGGDSSDDEIHMPLAVRDLELAERAFGGEDVMAEFEAEKAAIVSEDEEKMIDNTMPGWGSWGGEGIGKRAQKRNKGKVMTKKAGINKKDRKDSKLDRVIVNEKRVRKVRCAPSFCSISYADFGSKRNANMNHKQNEKYLASQLPHPFESRQQYERSLRLPVGPEWVTKESFQQGTKPRVIVKQGIIAPMAKPTI